MRNVLLLICALCFGLVQAQAPVALQGKCGAELKQAIADVYRPSSHVDRLVGEGSVWAAFRLTDNIDGYVLDRYSTEKRTFSVDGVSPTLGMTIDYIVDLSWWGENNVYGEVLQYDLYNILPCDDDVTVNKQDYPPGEVITATYNNGVWKSGYGEIAETVVNMYEPADEYKGDFARAIMYMMTIYPAARWVGLGVNFCVDNDYPTLNKYARRVLLSWHRADPVSDLECNRNNAIEGIQGNRNPYVDYPQLVEHVWGTESESPFDAVVERVPLKSTYRITENRIDLYHQSIPEDAEWRVNGVVVEGSFLLPLELGVGVHELRYSNSTTKGKIKIKIIE